MFSSSIGVEDNDKDNAVDNDFFAKLVDDLFLDNEYFTFPTNTSISNGSSSDCGSFNTTSSASSLSSNDFTSSVFSPSSPPNNDLSLNSNSDGSCLSPFSQSDESLTGLSAFPAPAPLAIPVEMNVSRKRSRDFPLVDSFSSVDQLATKADSDNQAPMMKKKKEKAFIAVQPEPTLKHFVGVTYHAPSNRFRARIKIDNKTTHLGYFKTELEAAVAYDRAAWELRGAKAHLNFDVSNVAGFNFAANPNLPLRERCVSAAKSATGITQLPAF